MFIYPYIDQHLCFFELFQICLENVVINHHLHHSLSIVCLVCHLDELFFMNDFSVDSKPYPGHYAQSTSDSESEHDLAKPNEATEKDDEQ
jgi:hypothetical protein